MALTKILIASIALVVTVHAGYVWQDDDNSGYKSLKMPNHYYPSLPPIPALPAIPPLPTFDQYGQLNFLPLPPLLGFPPLPQIPTPGQIRYVKPGPDQIYSGVAVKSSSGITKDKNGKVIKTGGSRVLTNNNGEVNEFKVGDTPPDLDTPIVIPSFPRFKRNKFPDFPKYEFPKFPEFKHIKIEPITFKPIVPINPDKIRNHKPGENENFVGYSTSSFSHSSDVDGVKSSGGGSGTLVNDNGSVEEENVRFGQHDKPKH